MKIVTIDPGESSGIIIKIDKTYFGITLRDHLSIWQLLKDIKPSVIVFENFSLRQAAASKLVGSKFYTVEVIGIIKLYALINKVALVELQPVVKEYCGFSSKPSDPKYADISMMGEQKITEHVRDAYRLYNYFRIFKEKEYV